MKRWTPYRTLIRDGLWTRNQAFVALLGLCPLLAVSSSVVNALGLGLATTLTLVISNGLVSAIRHWVAGEIRLPAFVLVIATTVTLIDLLMNAYFHELHKTLGLFVPLIVTNCAIMGRAELHASKNPWDLALVDGLFTGLGFTLGLVLLGAFREILGTGAVLNHAERLFGAAAQDWSLRLVDDYEGFLLAVLPPGAFIGLGLLIAGKNLIEARAARGDSARPPASGDRP